MRCAYNVHMRMHVHTGCLPPVAVVAACWLPPALLPCAKRLVTLRCKPK